MSDSNTQVIADGSFRDCWITNYPNPPFIIKIKNRDLDLPSTNRTTSRNFGGDEWESNPPTALSGTARRF